MGRGLKRESRVARAAGRRVFPARSCSNGLRRRLRLEPLEDRRLLTLLTVTSLADVVAEDGVITLREAIEAANMNAPVGDAPGGSNVEVDVIEFSDDLFLGGNATITFESGHEQLDIVDPAGVEIRGPGASLLAVDAVGMSRVFHVSPGAVAGFSDFTIRGGQAESGGGIHNEGTLRLDGATVTGNTATADGGGINNNYSGVLTITDSTISDNTANSGGGLAAMGIPGIVHVSRSTISGNTATMGGGGIHHFGGTLSIIDSTVSDNAANGGGGLLSMEGKVSIAASTISGNSAQNGGGILKNGGSLTLTNATLSDNLATANGGGLWTSARTLAINCTITANRADSGGGGIYVASISPVLHNSVVAENTTGCENDIDGTIYAVSSHNFLGAAGAMLGIDDGVNGNRIGTPGSPLNPMLGPLADNGGPTLTHAPQAGSPLLDAGSHFAARDALGLPLVTDQRGLTRQWGTVDVGAVEEQPLGVPVARPDAAVTNQGQSIALDVRVNDLPGGGPLEVEIVGAPSHGSLLQNPDGTLTYQPEPGFWGVDTFFYRIAHAGMFSNAAEVDVSVLSPTSILVTTAADEIDGNVSPDDISLREALGMVSPGGTIQFSAELIDSVIRLTQGTLMIHNVQIIGLGARHLTIEACGTQRVIEANGQSLLSHLAVTGGVTTADGGGINNSGTLTIADAAISGNAATGSESKGGGIFNYFDRGLTVVRSTFWNNWTTRKGGGVFNSGRLDVTDSTFAGNIATGSGNPGQGGGIYSEGKLDVTASTVVGNWASESGGGIASRTGTINIADSTVSGNVADAGAGIWLYDASATIETSCVSGNRATFDGGGIHVFSGLVTITNSIVADNSAMEGGGIKNFGSVRITGSTLSGNTAGYRGGGSHNEGLLALTNSTLSGNQAFNQGGGIYAGSGDVRLIQCTVVGNTAVNQGGALYNNGSSPPLLHNSVVAGNSIYGGSETYGHISLASSHNLIGASNELAPMFHGANGNQVGTSASPLDPMLGPLADNGGPTPTHAPLAGSPLIDAGNDTEARGPDHWPLLTDQRGFARRFGTVDIGAVEVQPPGIPVARGDAVVTQQMKAVTFDVLANDFCNDGSPMEVEIVAPPTHGELTPNPDGTLTYTHDPVFAGADVFSYRAVNGPFTSNTVEVVVSVLGFTSIIVTTADDEMDGDTSADDISLREALGMASPGQMIQFSPELIGQVIVLTHPNGPLNVQDERVVGLGAEHLAIDARGKHRVMDVNGNSEMSHLTITGGASVEGAGIRHDGENLNLAHLVVSGNTATGAGGGIYSSGDLTIIDSTIAGNTTGTEGGGIKQGSGRTLTISGSELFGNAAKYGGGISNRGTATVSGSTISRNQATDGGGGLYNTYGNMTIIGSLVSENVVEGGVGSRRGGGIFADYGTLEIVDSTISRNRVAGGLDGYDGGGIFASRCVLTITSSTLSENTASGSGGGLKISDAQARLVHCTIVANSAGRYGGGMSVDSSASPPKYPLVHNSVVAANTSGYPSDIHGTVQSVSSHNLVGVSGYLSGIEDGVNGNLIGEPESPLDPMLGPLADNGGPTPTHAPLVGSPLIDAGSNAVSCDSAYWPLATDQRGFARRFGTVDMGAVEDQPPGIPVARGDGVIGYKDAPVAFDVRENDFCNDGSVMAVEILSGPAHGELLLNPDGSLTYTPDAAFWGADLFSYRAVNGPWVSDSVDVVMSVLSPESIVVTTADDEKDGDLSPGDISLREAIYMAMPGDAIQFSAALLDKTIRLTHSDGKLMLPRDVQIIGPGAEHLTIDGLGWNGVIRVVNSADVAVSHVTITGGAGSGGIWADSGTGVALDHVVLTANKSTDGGGLHARSGAVVSLNHCIVWGNSAGKGGGVYGDEATLTVANSTISHNTAQIGGGGIYGGSGSLTIIDSTISDNTATDSGGHGGGIYSNGSLWASHLVVSGNLATGDGGGLCHVTGAAMLDDSTFQGNSAGGDGGGIHNGGTLQAAQLDVSGNSAAGGGGGIYNLGAIYGIDDSTFSENSADGDGGGVYSSGNLIFINRTSFTGNRAGNHGSGVYSNENGRLTIRGSTFTCNSSNNPGGSAIYSFGTLSVVDSVLRGNRALSGGAIHNQSGAATVTTSVISSNLTAGIRNNGTLIATNSTIAYNTGWGIVNLGVLGLSNSIVAANTPADISETPPAWGGYNLVGGTPGFIRKPGRGPDLVPGTLDDDWGNLRLRADSAAINAGCNALAVDGEGRPLNHDLDGRRRVVYGSVDAGAYEFHLVADADLNGTVDQNDATVLAAHWGKTGMTWEDGDFNGDGTVGPVDAAILAANWGAALVVPESQAPPHSAAVSALPATTHDEPVFAGSRRAHAALVSRRRFVSVRDEANGLLADSPSTTTHETLPDPPVDHVTARDVALASTVDPLPHDLNPRRLLVAHLDLLTRRQMRCQDHNNLATLAIDSLFSTREDTPPGEWRALDF